MQLPLHTLIVEPAQVKQVQVFGNKKITDIEKKLILQIHQYRKQIEMLSSTRVLSSKEALLDEYKMKIGLLSDKLDANMQNVIKDKNHDLSLLCAKLQAISPLNTLSRGYAIVQDETQGAISSVEKLNIGDTVNVSFIDGVAKATIQDINKLEDENV